MTAVLDRLLGLPVYLIVGLLVFAEDALFVGSCSLERPPPSSAGWPPAAATSPSP